MRRRISLVVVAAAALATGACGLVLALPDSTRIASGDGGTGPLTDATLEDGATATDAATPVEASPCGADLRTNALNCGVCGRSCLGGNCESGQCAALKLAEADGPRAMTIDAQFVYWLDNAYSSAIYRVPKAGGTSEKLADTGSLPNGLGVDAEQFFWMQGTPTAVLACPLAGCPDAGANKLFVPHDLKAITVGDGKLYAAGREAYTEYAVWQIPTGGGAPERLRDAGAKMISVTSGVLVRGDDDIRKGAASAGAAEEYVGPFVGELTAVVTDSTSTAWSEEFADGGGIVRWSGPAGLVVARGARPSAVAIDRGYVYWTNRAEPQALGGGGSVMACPLQGCPPEGPIVVVSPLEAPNGLAIDATHVYFTTYGSNVLGGVWRVPKL